jgi:hypothetical protein
LKLTFQCEAIIVQYFDEENDAVMIGSREELKEAMKFGKKCGNTLRVRVTESYPQPGENDTVQTKQDGLANADAMAVEPEVMKEKDVSPAINW